MITENQYKELCLICDKILLASESTFDRIAIPFLHVVRESPNLLRKYNFIFSNNSRFYTRIRFFLKLLYTFFFLTFNSSRYLFNYKKKFSFTRETFPKKVEVLFISHLLNLSHAGKSDDFYFSNLPDQLSDQGYSSVIALINHTSYSNNKLLGMWNLNQIPRVILTKSLFFLDELSFFRRMINESLGLRISAKKEPNSLLRKILNEASCQALIPGTASNLRLSSQICSLVSSLSPKAIIITYEGHAYERIIFASARHIIPGIKCIGYQHSILFRLQHSIFRNLQKEFNPDIILASGLNSKFELQKSSGLMNTRIEILGSNRSSLIQSNFCLDKKYLNIIHQNCKNSCLVIPEGNTIECNFILNFAKDCALLCPNIIFIFRLHPLLTFSKLVRNNSNLKDLPNNIIISNESFDKDTERSRWAIYRGTTAIIQAVLSGLQPVYINKPGEMTIDPLYSVNHWKLKVSYPTDFQKIVNSCNNNESEISRNGQKLLYDYCLNFFSKFDSNIIINLLNK